MTKVSVCMIAKNEENHLLRALESIVDIADEIIVTDTGSTDGSIQIARNFGAKVEFFAWKEDFSAAYNYCIEQAKGEWILLLDADEALLPSCCEEVRLCTERSDVLAYTVERRDLVDVNAPDVYSKMLQVRLFRNRIDLRFIGRIHHQFCEPLDVIAVREQLLVLPSEIELVHYGYANSNKEEKLARAARLMEFELNDRPGQFYYLVELGRTWIKMGDDRGTELLTSAAKIVNDDFQHALSSPGMLAALLEHILACDSLPEGFPLTWKQASGLATQFFPASIPLLWQLALKEYKQEHFAKCADLLTKIIVLGKEDAYDKHYSFQPSILAGDAMLNLGVCYTRLGKLSDARKCFRSLLELANYSKLAQMNLDSIRKLA